MEANDLNKSSQEKMNLKSGETPENIEKSTPDAQVNEVSKKEPPIAEPQLSAEKKVEDYSDMNQNNSLAGQVERESEMEDDSIPEESQNSKSVIIPNPEAVAEPAEEKELESSGMDPAPQTTDISEPVETKVEKKPEEIETKAVESTSVDTSQIKDEQEISSDSQPVEEKNNTIKDSPLTKKMPDDLLPPAEIDYSTLPREKLIDRFRSLLNNNPLHVVKGHLDAIRTTFETKSNKERAALKKKFLESGEAEDNFSPPADPLFSEFGELLQEFRKAREEERNRREHEMAKNLNAKNEVIENIKDLINRQESLNATFQEFRELQQKWRDIGPVPQKELHNLWETYHLHVENFYSYIKINKELRDLDLKKNLETKLELCEKAEKLLLEPTIVKAFNTLQKYHDNWRETGPVPREKKEELWQRFKEVTTRINQKHQEHFESIREQFEKNLQAKTELCEKAEALNQKEYHNPREWEKAGKTIIDLQQIWKTIGFAPKKENNAVYRRFRHACDEFFNRKREFFKEYKDAQLNNLEIKTDLCIQAEALKDSEDWKETTHEMIRIQKKWKETGPTPRRHSDVIWKRFRGACDHFFNRKSEFFSRKDEAQDSNLKLKEELIGELKAYQPGSNDEENFKSLQEFQNRWSEIGFVPFKEKDGVNNEFRELINAHFDRLNLDESNKSLQKYRGKLESWKSEGQSEDRLTQERNKIIGKLKQIESDINVWENNIGFFAKSKKSDALLRDFNHKIESGKRQIKLLNQKLDLMENMGRR